MVEINLPLIELRDYQWAVWEQLYKGVNKAMLVWHRRAGKDLFCLNYMIAKAIEVPGNYWFLLPETQQVRNSIWEGITAGGVKYLSFIPEELIYKLDNQSMKIYLNHPTERDAKGKPRAGSIISFLGGDRYDKRVGAGLQGCVISEWALQKPNLYDLAIEPMLKETKGWVLFNTTPRGNNHAKDMFDFLDKEPHYLADLQTIATTKDNNGNPIVKESDLAEERRRGKDEALIQQEYYCSFEGAIQGSYYGDMLKKYSESVGKYTYDAGYPVHTMWDLGISDSMAIWFIQFVGRDIHVIDYYENSNYALGHYASVLQGKGYQYAMHHLPHDGRQRQMTATEMAITIEQQLKNLDVYPITVHPARRDLYGAIQRTRAILSRCFFDKEKTKDGYESLKQYAREFDEKRNCFKDTPLHNWTSHGADAFSILPMIESQATKRRGTISKKWDGNFR